MSAAEEHNLDEDDFVESSDGVIQTVGEVKEAIIIKDVIRNYLDSNLQPLTPSDTKINQGYEPVVITTQPTTKAELDIVIAQLEQNARALNKTSNEDIGEYILSYFRSISGIYSDTGIASRKNAVFNNEVKVPDSNAILRPASVVIQNNLTPGEQVINLARSKYESTVPVIWPLWNSFIWVRIDSFDGLALNSFTEKTLQDSKELGYSTVGVCYTAARSTWMKQLATFVASRVTWSSIGVVGEEILEYIDIADYQSFINAAAAVLHSRGYDYKHRCSADPIKCQHEINGVVNPKYMAYIDTSKLSEAHVRFMSESRAALAKSLSALRAGSAYTQLLISKERVKEMRNRFYSKYEASAVIDKFTLRLKMPYLKEFFENSELWLNSLTESSSLILVQGSKARAEFLTAQQNTTKLNEYASYISSIEATIEDGDNINVITADKREDIISTLSSLSKDYNFRTKIEEGISLYPINTGLTTIGFPPFTCPSCGKPAAKVRVESEDSDSPLQYIIPIRADEIFFHLLVSAYSVKKMEG